MSVLSVFCNIVTIYLLAKANRIRSCALLVAYFLYSITLISFSVFKAVKSHEKLLKTLTFLGLKYTFIYLYLLLSSFYLHKIMHHKGR